MESGKPAPTSGVVANNNNNGSGNATSNGGGDGGLFQVIEKMLARSPPLVSTGALLHSVVALMREREVLAKQVKEAHDEANPNQFKQKLRDLLAQPTPEATLIAADKLVKLAEQAAMEMTPPVRKEYKAKGLIFETLERVHADTTQLAAEAVHALDALLPRNDVIDLLREVGASNIPSLACANCHEPRYPYFDVSGRDTIEWCNACRRLCHLCRIRQWAHDCIDLPPEQRSRCSHLLFVTTRTDMT
jgi:hypothetical protein